MNILTPADLPSKGIRLSRTTIWRLERTGIFPKHIRISPGRIGWIEGEVDAYLKARIEQREVAA